MKLTGHFILEEFTHSGTALAEDDQHLENLGGDWSPEPAAAAARRFKLCPKGEPG